MQTHHENNPPPLHPDPLPLVGSRHYLRRSISAELSDNLIDWQSGPALTELIERTDHGDGTATFTIRSTQAISPGFHHKFLRLTINLL